MQDILTHKDFVGSVQFSAKDRVFYGKIEGINDLVTFEGNTVKKLEKAFHEAAEDYIVLCKEVKKEPRKSYKGSFNVRVSPSVHRMAVENAASLGMSLNQFVRDAIKHEVDTVKTSLRGPKRVSGHTPIKMAHSYARKK